MNFQKDQNKNYFPFLLVLALFDKKFRKLQFLVKFQKNNLNDKYHLWVIDTTLEKDKGLLYE